jgi:hypothetical protein
MTTLTLVAAGLLALLAAGGAAIRMAYVRGRVSRDADRLRLIEKAENETRNDEQDYDAAGGLGAGVVGVPDERPDI